MVGPSWPPLMPGDGGVALGSAGELLSVSSTFNYLSQRVPRSLERNGKVGTKRGVTGDDSGMFGVEWSTVQSRVHNARGAGKTLATNGFELRDFPLREEIDFYNSDDVVARYYGECEALVQAATGATHVAAFDHNVRSVAGNSTGRKLGGNTAAAVQTPLGVVHGDYTITSAPERLQQLTLTPRVNDTYAPRTNGQPLLGPEVMEGMKDFMIVNVWRNIAPEPIQMYPLAMADASTVAAEDLVVFEIHYADRIGENFFCAHNEAHRWFYYPRMTRGEAILLKQWDSRGSVSPARDGKDAAFCLHSACHDPTTTPESPDRESIEVRCIAILG
eukprot:jgi/Tetstr1/455349/TSEL_042184.t1